MAGVDMAEASLGGDGVGEDGMLQIWVYRCVLFGRRGGVSPPAIPKNLMLSSIFADFGRGDPSPTNDVCAPKNHNLQVSYSYIASILSKCFKNWAGRDLMKVSVREAARFQLRESEIMPLTWPFQRLM